MDRAFCTYCKLSSVQKLPQSIGRLDMVLVWLQTMDASKGILSLPTEDREFT